MIITQHRLIKKIALLILNCYYTRQISLSPTFLCCNFNCLFSDITGPDIYSTNGFPLIAGTTSKLTCTVRTTLQDISLVWNCLGARQQRTLQENETQLLSAIEMEFKEIDQSKECTCTVKTPEFGTSSSVILDILSKIIFLEILMVQ